MKANIALIGLAALWLAISPTSASAYTCGAIACNTNGDGACGVAYGWADQADAESAALEYCLYNQPSCYIYAWECGECEYGPNGSYVCN